MEIFHAALPAPEPKTETELRSDRLGGEDSEFPSDSGAESVESECPAAAGCRTFRQLWDVRDSSAKVNCDPYGCDEVGSPISKTFCLAKLSRSCAEKETLVRPVSISCCGAWICVSAYWKSTA